MGETGAERTLARGSAADDALGARSVPESATEGAGPLPVIVVDDQMLERTGLALILDSDDRIEVVGEAGDGREAVDLVDRLRPAVVVMDVRMPVMNGIEATRRIVAAHPGTRVLVLTTFDLDEYAYGSLRAGASAFLLKSTTPEALVEAVTVVASGAAVVDPRLTARLIDHFLAAESGRGEVGERADTARAAGPGDAAADPAVLDVLSPREHEVFRAIVRGSTNAEISEALHLAPSTVKSHVNTIFAKLQLRDRVQAVILGHRLGLGG